MALASRKGEMRMRKAIYVLAFALGSAVLIAQTLPTSMAQNILALTLNQTTNQLTMGAAAHTLVISSIAPAGASQTLTLPDPTGADSVAYLALAQTLTNKTFTAPTINAYTMTGTGTIGNGATITTPVINGPTGNLGGSSTAANYVQNLTDPTTGNVTASTQTTFFSTNTVTIPASAFNTNGRALHCAAWGVTATNANTKGFQFFIGSSAALLAPATTTGSAVPFIAYLDIVRTGSNTQSGSASFLLATGVAPSIVQSTALGQTDSSSIAIAMQANNQSAAASAATGNGMTCSFRN